jgi:hypothetical protein
MARYRIVCVESKYFLSGKHDHIIAVGTSSSTGTADKRWAVEEVREAIDDGDEFYTKSETTAKEAKVRKFTCKECHFDTIRSSDDSISDNNLDNLRTCSWKS